MNKILKICNQFYKSIGYIVCVCVYIYEYIINTRQAMYTIYAHKSTFIIYTHRFNSIHWFKQKHLNFLFEK